MLTKTAIRCSDCIVTYLCFFSNVISLNNALSPFPPAPFPEGKRGECGAPARPTPRLGGFATEPLLSVDSVQYTAFSGSGKKAEKKYLTNEEKAVIIIELIAESE